MIGVRVGATAVVAGAGLGAALLGSAIGAAAWRPRSRPPDTAGVRRILVLWILQRADQAYLCKLISGRTPFGSEVDLQKDTAENMKRAPDRQKLRRVYLKDKLSIYSNCMFGATLKLLLDSCNGNFPGLWGYSDNNAQPRPV